MFSALKPYFQLSKRDQRASFALGLFLLLSISLPKIFEKAIANDALNKTNKKGLLVKKIITPTAKSVKYINNNINHYKHFNWNEYHRNASTMNYNDWDSLHIFEKKEIGALLKWRQQNGGKLSWRAVVVRFDLSKEQAFTLKKKVIIED